MSGIQVQVLLEQERVSEGAAGTLRGVVRLTAARQVESERPPVDLVACIDVSGSMEGRKLVEARRSAERLVRELDGRDRLGLVAFSSTALPLAPLRTMDAGGRAQATDAVRLLRTIGNTNMSAGLLAALDTLRAGQGADARTLRRVLLFTDGHANAGLAENDRAAWATLLGARLDGASVSWFGYGEDHDAEFLAWLADETKGNAYVAKNEDAIADAFARELGGLLGTVARDVRVRIGGVGGAPELVNEERCVRAGDDLVVELADLSSEERRDLVVTLPVAAGARGERRRVVDVSVSWVDARTGRDDSVRLTAEVSFVPPGEVDAPNVDVREATALQLGAAAMRGATALAGRGEYEAARLVLLEAALSAGKVPTERARELSEVLEGLARDFGGEEEFRSSRSHRTSLHRSMSRQRSSGSALDDRFETGVQRAMREKFGAPPTDGRTKPKP